MGLAVPFFSPSPPPPPAVDTFLYIILVDIYIRFGDPGLSDGSGEGETRPTPVEVSGGIQENSPLC